MMKLPVIPVKTQFTAFQGGLDTETPMISVKPGRLRRSQNLYQGTNGGYISLEGYERYSGQPKPSAAQYATLETVLSDTVAVGDVVTDDAGTSYGTVIAITSVSAVEELAGDGDGAEILDADGDGVSDAAVTVTTLIMTKLVGTFSAGDIKIGAGVVGHCYGAQVVGGASTSLLNAQYLNLAADEYRDDVIAVPGAGSVLGIWYYNGKWYAFRNNAAGTDAEMYVDSTAGWVKVELGLELNFTSGGTYVPAVGDTITGETSGATAVLTGVVLRDGAWDAGDAVGKFVFAAKTGNFQAETVKVGASLDIATIAGNAAAIIFDAPSGRFEFGNYNFTGSATTQKMYGVDGVNRGFEFNGTVFVPIETGMSIFPTHLTEHKYQLFFAYAGSAQHSRPGFQYEWDLLVGGDELGLSDYITGFVSQPGNDGTSTLAFFSRNSINMLYGSSAADWNLVSYKKGTGAIQWTTQFIGNTFALDDRGITKLSTSQSYGNFEDATASQLFQSWLKTKKTQVTASCVSLDKNLYCLFFADKSALFCTVDNGEIVAATPMLFGHKVTCICTTEDSSGNEVIMFGSDDGYVRQLFAGTSFDGDDIEWYGELSFDHLKTPTQVKRFRRSTFEIFGEGYAEFQFTYALGYESADIAQPGITSAEMLLTSGSWDTGNWDEGVWDGVNLAPMSFDMSGSATNISIRIGGNGDYHASLKFSGVLTQYSPTRETRS